MNSTKNQRNTVTVIIPTLNEARSIERVLAQLTDDVVDEILIIDGYSTDNTLEIVKEKRPLARIFFQTGKGKGNALKEGINNASGDIIVTLDADLSMNPGEIPMFVRALLDGNDYAKGSRFIKGGGSADISLLRKIGNFGLLQLTNLIYNARFTDLCYGYNAFWKNKIQGIELRSNGFEIETEITIKAKKAKLKIKEVPSYEGRRGGGNSKLNSIRDGWKMLKLILEERFAR